MYRNTEHQNTHIIILHIPTLNVKAEYRIQYVCSGKLNTMSDQQLLRLINNV